MNNLIDFHCHVDLYPDYESLIDVCERDRICTLAVTTTPKAWPRNRDLMMQKKYVRPALGLHPQLIGRDISEELMLWEKYLPEAHYIGEVGLDGGPRFSHTLNEQKRVFQRVLECCAEVGGKILSVHGVRSVGIILDFLEKFLQASSNKVVLHWFTGSEAEARRAIDFGCYFSINAEMIRTVKGLALVRQLPNERLLTETDGPFNQRENQPSRPKDVTVVIKQLSELRDTSPEIISRKIASNLKTLLTSKK